MPNANQGDAEIWKPQVEIHLFSQVKNVFLLHLLTYLLHGAESFLRS